MVIIMRFVSFHLLTSCFRAIPGLHEDSKASSEMITWMYLSCIKFDYLHFIHS